MCRTIHTCVWGVYGLRRWRLSHYSDSDRPTGHNLRTRCPTSLVTLVTLTYTYRTCTCVGRCETVRWQRGVNDVGPSYSLSVFTEFRSSCPPAVVTVRFTPRRCRSVSRLGRLCGTTVLGRFSVALSNEQVFAVSMKCFFWQRLTEVLVCHKSLGTDNVLRNKSDFSTAGFDAASCRRFLMTVINLVRRRISAGDVMPYVANCCRSSAASLPQSVTPCVAKLPANCSSRTCRKQPSKQSVWLFWAAAQLIVSPVSHNSRNTRRWTRLNEIELHLWQKVLYTSTVFKQ